MKLMLINGPNLNMLAYRNKEVYGDISIEKINEELVKNNKGIDFTFFISNIEGELVTAIQKATLENYDAIVINPGAYAHYSYAIRDALEIFSGKKIEVHLSDVKNRESFRSKLVNEDVVDKIISGYFDKSYQKAIDYLEERWEK